MKILHTVLFYAPHVGGSEEVIRQVSERLAARGHEVTVATQALPERTFKSLNGVRIEEFEIAGNATHGIKGDIARYEQFLREGEFDVMLNYAAQQWASDLAFPLLPDLPYGRVFVPCGFSALYHPDFRPYFDAMPAVLARYDELVFHADHYRDTDFARENGLTDLNIIPNGASEVEFAGPDPTFRERYGIPEDVPLLLTVGNHTGRKGHHLTIDAFRQADIGRAVLLVIGGQIAGIVGCTHLCRAEALYTRSISRSRKQVRLLNPPRADVVAAFHAADLFVFGSNIEYSPLVLFEALAAKTPFVSTACGNAEEIADWTGGGVIIPTRHHANGYVTARSRDLAHAIEQLMTDSARRDQLAMAGHEAWRERFTWDAITDRYEAVYRKAIAKRNA